FPKPLDRSSQIFTEFGKRYRIAVEKLLEKMKALDAPSDDEIRAETGSARRPGAYMRIHPLFVGINFGKSTNSQARIRHWKIAGTLRLHFGFMRILLRRLI
ncbi:MAG: hypothetical protein ACYTEU_08385, partial [Planctomycetota bacterium]